MARLELLSSRIPIKDTHTEEVKFKEARRDSFQHVLNNSDRLVIGCGSDQTLIVLEGSAVLLRSHRDCRDDHHDAKHADPAQNTQRYLYIQSLGCSQAQGRRAREGV
eukprot:2249978-Alexandrium_andersonii.AAC.2